MKIIFFFLIFLYLRKLSRLDAVESELAELALFRTFGIEEKNWFTKSNISLMTDGRLMRAALISSLSSVNEFRLTSNVSAVKCDCCSLMGVVSRSRLMPLLFMDTSDSITFVVWVGKLSRRIYFISGLLLFLYQNNYLNFIFKFIIFNLNDIFECEFLFPFKCIF